MLGPYAANVSSPELYTPGAKTLFLINYFTLMFFRVMVSALAVVTCVFVPLFDVTVVELAAV